MPTPTSTRPPRARGRMSVPGQADADPAPWGRRLLQVLLAVVLAVGVTAGGGAPAVAAPVPTPPVAFATQPDAPSRYQGQVSCSSGETPGAAAMRDLLRAAYGRANVGGSWRACSRGGTSEHKEGRAYDWMNNVSDPAQKAVADGFVTWLTGRDAQGVVGGNARRLGVQYVIWNRRTWQSWTGAWKPYTGASPHTDHVHLSFSWDGAYKRTSWWTGRAVTKVDRGPCVRYVGELAPTYSAPTYGTCPAPTTRPSVASGSVMAGGQTLPSGSRLTSPRGAVSAVMQGDGNVVLHTSAGRVLWQTRTAGNPGARLVLQTDGNLVVYHGQRPLWSSGTAASAGARLAVLDDGNLVLHRPDNRRAWASSTRL